MRAAWWWIDRWRKSTAYTDMTLAEQGAYRNLLDELWLRDGALPDDDRVLGKVCGDALGWAAVRERVLAHFRLVDGMWRNETHDEVQEESDRRAAKQKRYRDRQRAGCVTPSVTHNVTSNVKDNRVTSSTHSPSPSPSIRHSERAGVSTGVSVQAVTDSPLRERDGSRDAEEGSSFAAPAQWLKAAETEKRIARTADALRGKLLALVGEMEELDPKHRDAMALMRLVTGYDRPDGTQAGGVANPAGLSPERLEKSIEDAEWHLNQWRKPAAEEAE